MDPDEEIELAIAAVDANISLFKAICVKLDLTPAQLTAHIEAAQAENASEIKALVVL